MGDYGYYTPYVRVMILVRSDLIIDSISYIHNHGTQK